MSFLNNIKASIDDNSSMSVGGVSLLISSFIGFLLGLTMCFVLAYDVTTNGYVKTDLTELGIFLLCSGGYIAGSGIPKTIAVFGKRYAGQESRISNCLCLSNTAVK